MPGKEGRRSNFAGQGLVHTTYGKNGRQTEQVAGIHRCQEARMLGFLVEILYTVLLTLLLTYLIVNDIQPGWILMGSLIFLCLIVSIIATNFIAKIGQKPSAPADPSGTV
jgi:glycerol uptake facilitator-like aquaporin